MAAVKEDMSRFKGNSPKQDIRKAPAKTKVLPKKRKK